MAVAAGVNWDLDVVGRPSAGPRDVVVRRGLALLIDLLMVSVLLYLLTGAFGVDHVTGGSAPIPGHQQSTGLHYYSSSWALDWPWLAALAIAYFGLLELLFARTLGKLVTGIEVRGSDGSVPGWRRILVRNLIRPIDLLGGWALTMTTAGTPYSLVLGGLLGGLVAMAGPARQRLGDRVAGTVVVGARPVTGISGVTGWKLALVILAAIGLVLGLNAYAYRAGLPRAVEGEWNTGRLAVGGTRAVSDYRLGPASLAGDMATQIIYYDEEGGGTCTGTMDYQWAGFGSGWVPRGGKIDCSG